MSVVDLCGIGGFLVSIIGLLFSWKAYKEAEQAKNAVNQRLSTYRKHLQISEKVNLLKGRGKSICEDGVLIDARTAREIRQVATTLLSQNEHELSKDIREALKHLELCTSPFLSPANLNEQEAMEKLAFLFDALNNATAKLESEDFEYDKQQV